MFLSEVELLVPKAPAGVRLLDWLDWNVRERLPEGSAAVRLAVTESGGSGYKCEVTIAQGPFPAPASAGMTSSLVKTEGHVLSRSPIFELRKRRWENTGEFNAALLVPTGIGAAIGGHAGDATPVAQLLASVCDRLITHPNVVNASDINELPGNGLYVEGSVLCRLLMGVAGLKPVRANRVLALVNSHPDPLFPEMAINAVNAARATYGLDCPRTVVLDPPLVMQSEYTGSARAAGSVQNLENLLAVLEEHRGEYDAVAVSSVINVPFHYHADYFGSDGGMVNPWGGVESMLTHTISTMYNVPSAHSPMLESQAALEVDTGVVDPRLAAEAVSMTFFQSVLKGLQRSPRIVTDEDAMREAEVLTVSDVSCMVIPDGCLGIPTLAVLEQGIPVIAVRENRNLMKNDLADLPWRRGQFIPVDNYWEAAGVMAALKSGIDPASVRRPILPVEVEKQTGDLGAGAGPVFPAKPVPGPISRISGKDGGRGAGNPTGKGDDKASGL